MTAGRDFRKGAGLRGHGFTIPIVAYLFVIVIGTDYNILIAGRFRLSADVLATRIVQTLGALPGWRLWWLSRTHAAIAPSGEFERSTRGR